MTKDRAKQKLDELRAYLDEMARDDAYDARRIARCLLGWCVGMCFESGHSPVMLVAIIGRLAEFYAEWEERVGAKCTCSYVIADLSGNVVSHMPGCPTARPR